MEKIALFSGVSNVKIDSFRSFFASHGLITFYEEAPCSMPAYERDSRGDIFRNAVYGFSRLKRIFEFASDATHLLIQRPTRFPLIMYHVWTKGGRRSGLSLFLWAVHSLQSTSGVFSVVQSFDGAVGRRVALLKTFGFLRGAHICSFQGLDISEFSRELAAERYAFLFESADAVCVPSRYIRNLIVEAGCEMNKIHMVAHPIDFAGFPVRSGLLFPDDSEPLLLISVGRLLEIKGHEFTIRSVSRLLALGHDVRLTIVGGGPDEARLRILVSDLGLERYVTFAGNVEFSKVLGLLQSHHVFVHASITLDGGEAEALAKSIAEAQYIGLPCIVTDSGGNKECVIEELGNVVPERDSEAIADAVISLLDCKSYWGEMVSRSRDFVETKFGSEGVCSQYDSLYRSLTSKAI